MPNFGPCVKSIVYGTDTATRMSAAARNIPILTQHGISNPTHFTGEKASEFYGVCV